MASPENPLSHLDETGAARMVDVSEKADTAREAVAEGYVRMEPATLALILEGGIAKGDVIAVARIAGIMGAKQTSSIIPMCHPIPITGAKVDLQADGDGALRIEARVKTEGKTGVEMEALSAVTIAALTVYDMCKAVDRGMRIAGVRLLEKRGGKSGEWLAETNSEPADEAAVALAIEGRELEPQVPAAAETLPQATGGASSRLF